MANYNSSYSGTQIDTAVGKALAPSNTPTSGSGELITSGGVADALADKAPLASPALTGNPTAPTQATGNNSTKLATTAFVKNVMAAAPSYMPMDSVPTNGSNNPVKSDGVYDALAGKQPTLTFDAEPEDGSLNPARSGGIYNALERRAPITSPALKGTPSAPNPAQDDSSTRLATTRFVHAFIDPLMDNLVEDYDSTKSYYAGDYFLLNGKIYKVKTTYPRYIYSPDGKDGYQASDGKVFLVPQYSTGRSANRTLAILANDITALSQRIPAPPSADGTYRLTVTVVGGVPTYSWT